MRTEGSKRGREEASGSERDKRKGREAGNIKLMERGEEREGEGKWEIEKRGGRDRE